MAEAVFAPLPGDNQPRDIDGRFDDYFKQYPHWQALDRTQDSDTASILDMTRAGVQEYEPLNEFMDEEEFARVTRAMARRSLRTLTDPLGAALATLSSPDVGDGDQRP